MVVWAERLLRSLFFRLAQNSSLAMTGKDIASARRPLRRCEELADHPRYCQRPASPPSLRATAGSEAICRTVAPHLDCFTSFAMTGTDIASGRHSPRHCEESSTKQSVGHRHRIEIASALSGLAMT